MFSNAIVFQKFLIFLEPSQNFKIFYMELLGWAVMHRFQVFSGHFKTLGGGAEGSPEAPSPCCAILQKMPRKEKAKSVVETHILQEEK